MIVSAMIWMMCATSLSVHRKAEWLHCRRWLAWKGAVGRCRSTENICSAQLMSPPTFLQPATWVMHLQKSKKRCTICLPEGVSVKVSGQREAQEQAFSGLLLSALLAIVLVCMVLSSQFKSLLQPVIIMMSVPLGLAGVMVALF